MAQEAMNKGIVEKCWTGLDCKGWGLSKIIAIKATQERTEELNKQQQSVATKSRKTQELMEGLANARLSTSEVSDIRKVVDL